MRVAICGGSYDPITIAELSAAAEIVHDGSVDEVWIVPCQRSDQNARKVKTSLEERLLMCHMAVNTRFGARFPVKVCDPHAALFTASEQ